jgi:hypothetical protein
MSDDDDDNSKRVEELRESLSAMAVQALEDCYKSCAETLEELSIRKREDPNNQEISRDFFMVGNLAVLYKVTIKNRKTLNAFNKAIQRLPKREEFEEFKTAIQGAVDEQDKKLADTDQKVIDTLEPINDFLKNLKESREGSSGDMYG